MNTKKVITAGLLVIGVVLILLFFYDSEAWAKTVNYAEYLSTEFLDGLQNMLEQSNILLQEEERDLWKDFLEIVECLLNGDYNDVCELLKVIDTCGEEDESLKHDLKSVVGEFASRFAYYQIFSGSKTE